MSFEQQLDKVKTKPGFIAALDQSGGSTPKALGLYGVNEDSWSNDDEMFAVVHEMRTRIMTSPAFNGDRILGAILFENTMDREVEGQPTARYLWNVKNVVPFLKVDKGLAEVQEGAQVMNPMPGLADLLEKANANGVFGTKMRSVIKEANATGIDAVVKQQFDIAVMRAIEQRRTLQVRPEDIHDWANPSTGQLFLLPRHNWWNHIVDIESVDQAKGIIKLKKNHGFDSRLGDRRFGMKPRCRNGAWASSICRRRRSTAGCRRSAIFRSSTSPSSS